MVSSSVYGTEDLLDQIYSSLIGFGYTVWMSHKNTIPTNSNNSSFEDCLEAARRCNIFLGIITGRYGRGVPKKKKGITQQEIELAIKINKQRWILVHNNVVIARQLLKNFKLKKNTNLKKNPILDDTRILQIYNKAVRSDVPHSKRRGNWVHHYHDNQEALFIINNQLSDINRIRLMLNPRKSKG